MGTAVSTGHYTLYPDAAKPDVLTDLESNLNCSICLEIFTEPQILSCLHTFCKQCLEGLYDAQSSIPCPKCSKVTRKRLVMADARLTQLVSIYNQHVGNTENEEQVTTTRRVRSLSHNDASTMPQHVLHTVSNDPTMYSSMPAGSHEHMVKQQQQSRSGAWDGKLKSLTEKPFLVQPLAPLVTNVNQLLLVVDQMLALADNHIMVLDARGEVRQTLTLGCKFARDMCLVSPSCIVVATMDSGLLQLSTHTRQLRHIERGHYGAVASSCDGSVWGVKEKGSNVWLVHLRVAADTCEKLQQLHVDMTVGGGEVYCALLGQLMYISRYYADSILVVDLQSGHTVTSIGSFGATKPGALYQPSTIYCDATAQQLMVLDTGNNRVQFYSKTSGQWTVAATRQMSMRKPRAAALDCTGALWIAGHRALYKCMMRSSVRRETV